MQSYYEKRTLRYSEFTVKLMTLGLVSFGNFLSYHSVEYPILLVLVVLYSYWLSRRLWREVIR